MKTYLKFVGLAPILVLGAVLPLNGQTATSLLNKVGLRPVGTPNATETQQLNSLFSAAAASANSVPLGPDAGATRRAVDNELRSEIESFLTNNPASPWGPSLHLLLARRAELRCGYSLALDHYEAAVSALAGASSSSGQAISHEASGGLARMFMLTGRTSDFDALAASLSQLDLQPVGGGWGWANETRAWVRKHPDEAFKCGLYCLDQLGRVTQPGQFVRNNITEVHSSTNGYTAADLVTIGGNAGLRLHAALLATSNSLPVPSILHLRCEHFVVVREQRGAFYSVLDPVASGPRWLTAQDLLPELSGCAVVSDARPPAGGQLTPIDAIAAASYRGRCHDPHAPDHEDNPCGDDQCCPPGGTPFAHGSALPSGPMGGSGPAGATACAGCSGKAGMPTWFVSEPFLTLWIRDTPLEYKSAFGPVVSLDLAYHDRNQPSIVSWEYNQGARIQDQGAYEGLWSCSWLSFAELDDLEATVDLMMPAGGWATFNFSTNSGTSASVSSVNYRSNTWLEKQGPAGGITNLLLHLPDGAIYTYGVLDTNTAAYEGFAGLFYLCSAADAAGNATTFSYDSNFYLTNVTAADGTTFSLQHGDASIPDLITGVTASYGSSVSFGQWTDNIYRRACLTNITDAAGISSQFVYEFGTSGGAPTELITPYGTTAFSELDTGTGVFDRSVQITNAVGTQEVYGLENSYSGSSWPDFSAGQIPTNTPIGTLDSASGTRQERNTFYWNAQQYPLVSGVGFGSFDWAQFKAGRIRHWLTSTYFAYTHFDTLSLEQAPSPDGSTEGQITWYDYAGKPTDDEVGTQIMPSVIARVMPEASTWYQYFQRLTNGLPTQVTEQWVNGGVALSRTDSSLYAANNTDLLAWTNALGLAAQVNVFNAYHQVATNYDALNQMTTYSYDATTHLLTGISTPSGLSTTYVYDGSHRLQRVEDQPVGRTNSYTWNSDGTIATHTDPRGLTVTNFWDGLHRLTGVRYPDGTTTSNRYDLISGTPYPNSSGGTAILDLTASKDRLSYWSYFTYDAIRRRIFETNANGVVTAYGYCDCGSVSSKTNALGTAVEQDTIYNRDYQGNLTTTLNADGYNVTNWFDSLARKTATADGWGARWLNYDNLGRLTSVSNAFGVEQQTTYDLLDRPYSSTDANGVIVTNAYDYLGRVTIRGYPDGGLEKFGYSARGLVVYTNQLGYITRYAYDEASRKTYETNANTEIIRYTNNAASDLLSLTDGKNQITRWNYDTYGRVTNKLDQGGSVILKYAYDADSRLTNRWSAAMGSTGYAYDRLGNLTNIAYPSSGTVSFACDAVNRVTTIVDGLGTTRYTYTAAGQLLTEGGLFGSDTMTNTYVNRKRVALSLQQPTGVWTNGFGWDAAGRLTNVVSPAGAFPYTYTRLGAGFSGQLIQELGLPNSAYITNFYDPVARLRGTLLKSSGGTTLDSALYGYNAGNQRTAYTNATGTNVLYTYDHIGQLKTVTSSASSESLGYAYDAAWNLNWRTNSPTVDSFSVDGLNQLTNAYLYYDNGNHDATYDANGNVVTVNVDYAALINSYFYDDENHLIYLTYSESGSALNWSDPPQAWGDRKSEFHYDGWGRLRERLEYTNDTTYGSGWAVAEDTRYVYDGWRVIEERDGSGNPTVAYTRGLDLSGSFEGAGGIGGLLARSSGYSSGTFSSHAYYHADAGGNVTCLLDGSQAVAASYRYDPFGNTIAQSGTLADDNTYRFSSKEIHTNSLMYYYGYRFYDPSLQRWMSRDPLGEWDDINLYAFAYNGPTRYLDSDGLQVVEPPPAQPKPKPSPPPAPSHPKPKPPIGKPKPPAVPKPSPLPKRKPFPACNPLSIFIGIVVDPPAFGDPEIDPRVKSCTYFCPIANIPYTISVPISVPCPESIDPWPGVWCFKIGEGPIWNGPGMPVFPKWPPPDRLK